jgi:hypothetical protein
VLIFLFDAFHQPAYFEFELPDSRVDDIERIIGVVIRIHLELDETGRDEAIYDSRCLMVL